MAEPKDPAELFIVLHRSGRPASVWSEQPDAADAAAGWNAHVTRYVPASELDALRANNDALLLCLDSRNWVPTAERMPAKDTRVLVLRHGSRAQEASFTGQYWVAPNFDVRGEEVAFPQAQVTHWTPMPLTPEQLEKREW